MADQTPTPDTSSADASTPDPSGTATNFAELGAQLLAGAAPNLSANAIADTIAMEAIPRARSGPVPRRGREKNGCFLVVTAIQVTSVHARARERKQIGARLARA